MPKILGVKIDKVNIDQAVGQAVSLLKKPNKHYIVTPNIEFIMAAQEDAEFKKILNQADLSIPDSARLGWAYSEAYEKNIIMKLLKWPLFLVPNLFRDIPVVAGVDLMNRLCGEAAKEGFRIGLLGGNKGVAAKALECLKKMYPGLKIYFSRDGGRVKSNGVAENPIRIAQTDILFVAFGAPKQEKWIAKNIGSIDAKLFMGVGGAFDYLAGMVPRAPQWIRILGLEWLYRLIQQPWRIKRFSSLVKFIFLILWA